MSKDQQIAIIGGGAAGLAAAIAAARAGASVTVLEAGKRVGSKILKTGNGRCNLTNMGVGPADYNDPEFVSPVIGAWPGGRVREFFETLGMMSVEENEGRVYPLSNSANTVLDVLRAECERLDVETLCEHEIISIRCLEDNAADGGPLRHFERSADGAESRNLTKSSKQTFTLTCSNGASFETDRIIAATGGGTKLLAGLGHTIAPFQPVLCPLKTDTALLKGLDGVRAHARVHVFRGSANDPVAELSGEVLFRNYGVSGIVIFDTSRYVAKGDTLGLDFFPEVSQDELQSWLAGRLEVLVTGGGVNVAPPTYAELMCGLLHSRLNNAIVRAAGCRPSDTAALEMLPALARAGKDFRLQVLGPGDPKQAQVTRGGAITGQFDPATLESLLHPGVFAAGETLDIDGRCGGFNLHWAWASGITAGTNAAR